MSPSELHTCCTCPDRATLGSPKQGPEGLALIEETYLSLVNPRMPLHSIS